ncbi:hypothetical protein BgiBS90_010266, partial [Biomphalaria glabrata]
VTLYIHHLPSHSLLYWIGNLSVALSPSGSLLSNRSFAGREPGKHDPVVAVL